MMMYLEEMLVTFTHSGCWKNSRSNAHGALKVISLAVLDEIVDDQDTDEEDDRLEAVEVESHVAVDDPTEDDEEGSDKDCDLQTASHGDSDGQIHLALVRDNDCGDVLSSISNDWQ